MADAASTAIYRDRIEELEYLVGLPKRTLCVVHFTRTEFKIVGLLLKHELVTREFIWRVLYGGMPDCDQPRTETVDVHLTFVRRKLRKQNISIATDHGHGWYLTKAERAKLEALLKERP
jgi:DNA-binding response OmpR family regulator